MIAGALLLLTLGLFLAAARGRPGLTFAVLVGTTLLVPSTLSVPGLPGALFTVTRVVAAGALLGVLLAARRGRLDRRHFAAHVVMLPLLAYLATIAVTGIALADPAVSVVAGSYLWLGQAEQGLFLFLALVLGRALPARQILLTLAAGASAVGVVALGEYATDISWAHTFFLAVPDQLGTVPASLLEPRAGALRVRVAGDFALQTGWMVAALLPAVVCAAVLAIRRRAGRTAWLLAAAVPLTALAVALTRSRSPLAAVAVLAAVLLVVLAWRRPAALVAAGLLQLALLLSLGPWLLAQLSPSVDQGSIDVRVERLPEVLALPADSPLRGTGLSGIQLADLPGLDTSYVLTYVETGAIGGALLLVLVAFATGSVLRGLRRPRVPAADPDDGLLALAASLGVLALVASAFTLDTFQAQASNRLTWLLVGLGLVAAERRRGPQPLPSLYTVLGPVRWGLVVVSIVAGAALAELTPTHVASRTVFSTGGVASDVAGLFPGSSGRTLVFTTCELAEQLSIGRSWEVSSCREQGPPGWGVIRLEAPDAPALVEAHEAIFATARELAGLGSLAVGLPAEGAVEGTPTAARVAPWILPLLAASAALLLPPLRRSGGPGGRQRPAQPLGEPRVRVGEAAP